MTNTRKPKRPHVAKEWTRKVFNWLRQIRDDTSLPNSRALFALQITEYVNRHKGGVGWASCRTIATDIGMSEASVVNLFHAFERRGHLKVEWGKQGKGHSNRYWMVLIPQSAEVYEARKPQSKPQSIVPKPQPTEVICLNNHSMGNAKAFPHRGERVQLCSHIP